MSTENNSRVFHYFSEINKIPRCSGNEEKITDYLVNFAEEKGLKYHRDNNLNVYIYKEASKGYEDYPPIILQGHSDMVCEVRNGCDIDLLNTGIEPVIEDDFIIAKDTTLGADNGIAVAMILAVLEDSTLAHPKIEALITADEEDGMTGANNLEKGRLEGTTLINLDSEEEGILYAGCAGGIKTELTFKKEYEEVSKGRDFYELSISGLRGGHSGSEIHTGLGNGIVLLSRALNRFNEEFNIDLVEISAGSKANAIPRDARAIIGIDSEDLREARKLVINLNNEFIGEIGVVDPDVRLNFESSDTADKKLSENLKGKIINLLNILPNGVNTISREIENLVESSNNLGVIIDSEEEISIILSVRSSKESLKKYLTEKIGICASLTGAEFSTNGEYPAWEYAEHSTIRDITIESYKKLYNETPQVTAIHAGLECGLFTKTIGPIDMISFGPTMYGAHAPGERLSISSTERTYELLLEILKTGGKND